MRTVVHAFNADQAKQGTTEELDDREAHLLVRTGRARYADTEAAQLAQPPADPSSTDGQGTEADATNKPKPKAKPTPPTS